MISGKTNFTVELCRLHFSYERNMGFEEKSYDAHQSWLKNKYYNDDVLTVNLHDFYSRTDVLQYRDTISYQPMLPLMNPNDSWITVGDCYGNDAAWLTPYCKEIMPIDIQDTFLKLALQEGIIKSYAQQNAEKMTFNDASFDYALCREAYHHFPRPYIAVYEMIRCVKKGVVFQEPIDPLLKMPLFLYMCNILDTKRKPLRSTKFWKNRFSFEAVGNYVYKTSPREFEKIAMGIGLPAIAFYYYNDCASIQNLKKLKRKLKILNFLCKLKVVPYNRLTTILFKELPDRATIEKLQAQGYYYYELPKNPYI